MAGDPPEPTVTVEPIDPDEEIEGGSTAQDVENETRASRGEQALMDPAVPPGATFH